MDAASRTAYRALLTRLINSCTEYLNSVDSKATAQNSDCWESIEEELNTYLQRIQNAKDSLERANIEVHRTLKVEDYPKELEAVLEYQDKAITTIARINQRLLKLRKLTGDPSVNRDETQRTDTSSRASGVKLPKLNLRKFSGDSKDWLPFWEQYRSSIHENLSLSAVDKFNYLQASLEGKAAQVIAGFTPTEACYDGAIGLLLEEYGNTEKLIDKTMSQLMAISPIHSNTDADGLRCLYNTIMSCKRSLTALGISSTQYSIMLKSIVLKCLPSELRIAFHRFRHDKQNDTSDEDDSQTVRTKATDSSTSCVYDGDKTIKFLLSFLKREVESLESAAQEKRNRHKPTTTNKGFGTAAGLLTSSATQLCIFCNSSRHGSADCDSSHSLSQRKEILKRSNRCYRCVKHGHNAKVCKNRKLCCKICKGRHVTSMCDPEYRKNLKSTEASQLRVETDSCSQKTMNLCAHAKGTVSEVYLQAACGFISAPKSSNRLYARVILDGGSQVTFVKESIAHKLKLPKVGSTKLSVIPFGSSSQTPARLYNRVAICLASQFDHRSVVVEAVAVPEICFDVIPTPSINDTGYVNMELADARPTNLQPEVGISVLIGADNYWLFATGEVKLLSSKLAALNTILGWTLQGPAVASAPKTEVGIAAVHLVTSEPNEDSCTSLWDLDTIGIKPEDVSDTCLDGCIVKGNNFYIASLPWKKPETTLDSNKSGALNRLKSLVNRLSKEPSKLIEYDKIMWEFITAGYAETVIDENVGKRIYYMPHRPVYRADKVTTKTRIVFDASSHAKGVLSLNEHLHTGANLLPDVLKIMLNFRFGSVGIVADIEKAFLRILLHKEDRDSHRFYWFSERLSVDKDPSIQAYRMTRVTFGVTCSPYLLGATIRDHLKFESKSYPKSCDLLAESFYMDDLVCSTGSEEEAIMLYRESSTIMHRANMNLRKWNSNSAVVRKQFENNESCPPLQKVLGIKWYIKTDELAIDIDSVTHLVSTNPAGTKRNILSTISRFFDPFGFIGPYIVKLKILFQDCWRLKVNWDDDLPRDLLSEWNRCLSDLEYLKDLSLPRNVLSIKDYLDFQLHIFTDSSQKAYGAVAYLRIESKTQHVDTKFICAKNRIAPLREDGTKELSLPRLELTAALIGARLFNYLTQVLKIQFDRYFLWTDSMITLYWIQTKSSNAKKWKPYVSNRVQEIQRLTDISKWAHCPGSENPADLLTRGITGKALYNNAIWLNGPEWLKSSQDNWPSSEITIVKPQLVSSFLLEIDNAFVISKEPLLSYENYSSWKRLLRVTSYIIRFCFNLKRRMKAVNKFPTSDEIEKAELYWVKYFQLQENCSEIQALLNNCSIPGSSSICTLRPILDEHGILRVKGRLQFLNAPEGVLHPIILPRQAHISRLIVEEIHQRSFHSGVNAVLARLREKYWINKARPLIKRIIGKCVVCKRLRAKPASQPFSPLPPDRMITTRPFAMTGIDFAGPLYVRRLDEEVSKRVYILLLTCGATRAVHLELVPDLTAENCLNALRRFIARRGTPAIIYSDNAKTFQRVSKDLSYLDTFFRSEKFFGFLTTNGIKWKFIVERAPWWGGFWERLVKSVKDALKATIGRAVLSSEQLYTLLTEVESVVNGRPITYITEDSSDISPLTPAHFLLGCVTSSNINLKEDSTAVLSADLRKRWSDRLITLKYFWKRWKTEYLVQLRLLHHGLKEFSTKIRVNDVVLLQDPSLPRICWPLAVVENVFPGRDGKIRSCLLRTANGTKLKRPIQLMYPLEVS